MSATTARALPLGDFTTDRRVGWLAVLAFGLGIVGTLVARALLWAIAFVTNVAFFGRFSAATLSPAQAHLGWWLPLVPATGGLVIGLMARYGSERIRGHGIPEAIESILMNGSRFAPRVELLKPVSAAISIGTGGPFGAEGPIILTGGAVGSLAAQFLHLTSAERKTLLVAGAAAGMSATFGTPVAAVLLAVELLLFEWKPRSVLPVAIASATAAVLRPAIIGGAPLFPVPPHPSVLTLAAAVGCLLSGVLAGALSWILTRGVYAAEDLFEALPVHWMWWPALGGLVIGAGGLLFPEALGVGYDVIANLLTGTAAGRIVVGVLLVKSVIWIVALGSGTSGGVLAPLLMMGAALGALESGILPDQGVGFWPLVSMAAILGGTMRVPFTAIVFAMELTWDVHAWLPLLIAVTAAYAITVLALPRSILTEKISRRGYHVSREYAVDPLEILAAREVMRPDVVTLQADPSTHSIAVSPARHAPGRQRLFPVVDGQGRLLGVLPRTRVPRDEESCSLDSMLHRTVVTGPHEPLRIVVRRMAETGLTRFPVVDGDNRVLGMIGLGDLLTARVRLLEAESRRTREIGLDRVLRYPTSLARAVRRERIS
jgi:H+/Cl- antiporter ClcA/CBS domain-containing protein